jgi:hypothetical protein
MSCACAARALAFSRAYLGPGRPPLTLVDWLTDGVSASVDDDTTTAAVPPLPAPTATPARPVRIMRRPAATGSPAGAAERPSASSTPLTGPSPSPVPLGQADAPFEVALSPASAAGGGGEGDDGRPTVEARFEAYERARARIFAEDPGPPAPSGDEDQVNGPPAPVPALADELGGLRLSAAEPVVPMAATMGRAVRLPLPLPFRPDGQPLPFGAHPPASSSSLHPTYGYAGPAAPVPPHGAWPGAGAAAPPFRPAYLAGPPLLLPPAPPPPPSLVPAWYPPPSPDAGVVPGADPRGPSLLGSAEVYHYNLMRMASGMYAAPGNPAAGGGVGAYGRGRPPPRYRGLYDPNSRRVDDGS